MVEFVQAANQLTWPGAVAVVGVAAASAYFAAVVATAFFKALSGLYGK